MHASAREQALPAGRAVLRFRDRKPRLQGRRGGRVGGAWGRCRGCDGGGRTRA